MTGGTMITTPLVEEDTDELYCDDDPEIRHRSSWPAWGGEGSDGAACYFEIPPGCRLGNHIHDSEELVVVLSGAGTATISGTSASVEAPHLVVMPEGETHDIVNDGPDPLRAVGYFPAPSVTTTFEVVMQPGDSKVAGTPDRAPS